MRSVLVRVEDLLELETVELSLHLLLQLILINEGVVQLLLVALLLLIG